MRFVRLALPVLAVFVTSSPASALHGSQQVTEAGYPEPGSPAVVKLNSPGKVPRVPLRYAMPAGAKASVNMTLTTEMSMDVAAGLQAKVPMTSLLAGVELAVKDVSSSGDVVLDVGFVSLQVDRTNPRVDLAAAKQVEASLVGLTPFRGTIVMTNRGVVKSDGLDLSAMAKTPGSGSLRDFVWLTEHITPVLPDEPVGVGAKWESRQAFHRGGVTSFQRVEFEVTSIAGEVIKLKSSITQMAPKQQVLNPDLTANPNASLEKMSGKGSYSSTIVLNALAPTVQGSTTTTVSMRAADTTLRMSTTLFSGIKPVK